jgi:hypothetical protein
MQSNSLEVSDVSEERIASLLHPNGRIWLRNTSIKSSIHYANKAWSGISIASEGLILSILSM